MEPMSTPHEATTRTGQAVMLEAVNMLDRERLTFLNEALAASAAIDAAERLGIFARLAAGPVTPSMLAHHCAIGQRGGILCRPCALCKLLRVWSRPSGTQRCRGNSPISPGTADYAGAPPAPASSWASPQQGRYADQNPWDTRPCHCSVGKLPHSLLMSVLAAMYFTYPIWTFWLGRLLLSGKLTVAGYKPIYDTSDVNSLERSARRLDPCLRSHLESLLETINWRDETKTIHQRSDG